MTKRECGICEVGQMHTCGLSMIDHPRSENASLHLKAAELERDKEAAERAHELDREIYRGAETAFAGEQVLRLDAEKKIADLTRQLEEAKTMVEAWEKMHENACIRAEKLAAIGDNLQSLIAKKDEAFKKYAWHLSGCGKRMSTQSTATKCSCGYSQTLAELGEQG